MHSSNPPTTSINEILEEVYYDQPNFSVDLEHDPTELDVLVDFKNRVIGEAKTALYTLIADSLPQEHDTKRYPRYTEGYYRDIGYNAAIDEVTQILERIFK